MAVAGSPINLECLHSTTLEVMNVEHLLTHHQKRWFEIERLTQTAERLYVSHRILTHITPQCISTATTYSHRELRSYLLRPGALAHGDHIMDKLHFPATPSRPRRLGQRLIRICKMIYVSETIAHVVYSTHRGDALTLTSPPTPSERVYRPTRCR